MAQLEGATQEERIAALVVAVGGPVRAAALIGKTRTHVDNMRKAGAPLRLEDVLVLAREAGVTLDWVATGQAVRADLRGLASPEAGTFDALPGFVRLLPLRPEVATAGGRMVERWTPSEFAVSTLWLGRLGLSEETARYALAGDGGMAPAIGKGAFLVLDARQQTARTGLYLVAVGDELLPRRLNRLPDGTSELIADADPRWRFVVGEAVEMFRIVWVGQGM
jgi:phage repressor protein C with HTH and peptisase S24 domain